MEEYTGVKFKVIFKGDKKQTPAISDFAMESAGSSGNISFREGDSFFITATGCKLGELTADDFVKVLKVSENEVTVAGDKEPSSEAMLHAMIYNERSDVDWIIHLHDYPEDPNMPITEKEQPYGTQALVDELRRSFTKGIIWF